MADMVTNKADAVFEGGGVKGIGFAGALEVAERNGIVWQNLAGTSAGAIVATLLAAGYKASEIKTILDDLNYNNFKDASWFYKIPLLGALSGVLVNKGIYKGDYFQDWIAGLLKAKNITTFGDLVIPDETEEKYKYKLRVVTSDITNGNMIVLPQDMAHFGVNPDDLNVAIAVRMSMSIPYFYKPINFTSLKSGVKNYFVDGGLLSNFPVWLFDTQNSEPEWPTFGFKLIEPDAGSPHNIKGPFSLLTALFSTMMEAHDSRHVTESDFVRTIPIPTLGIKTTEFDITKERSQALYESGQKAAEKFFSSWDFKAYIAKYRK